MNAQDLCKRSEGNLTFSESLIFIVENNMVDVFNMLRGYGGKIIIYGDIAKKLVLTALIKQNLSDIFESFPKKTIHVYNKIREYFAEDNLSDIWNRNR